MNGRDCSGVFYSFPLYIKVGASLVAPEETQQTWIPSLGGEDPLKKEMATHSSIPAWEVLQTEEPGRLQSMGSHRVGHGLATRQQQIMEDLKHV